jgi:hypothetical protein
MFNSSLSQLSFLEVAMVCTMLATKVNPKWKFQRVHSTPRNTNKFGCFQNRLYICIPLEKNISCGSSSAGRASPCQGEGRGFESRLPLKKQIRIDLFFLFWATTQPKVAAVFYTIQIVQAIFRIEQPDASFFSTHRAVHLKNHW